MLNTARNKCAHNERFYSFVTERGANIKKTASFKNFKKKNNCFIDTKKLFAVVIILKEMLPPENFNAFVISLDYFIKRLETQLKSISINDVYRQMDFAENWIKIRETN